MERLRRNWKKLPTAIRKPLVLIVGTVVIIIGLILVPLPGPGWVIVFFGFAVLATEFAFAERLRVWVLTMLKTVWTRVRQTWQKTRK